MWSAVCIAAVFEFLGALLLGGQVTKTIAGGIAKTSTFAKAPQLFMYGMLTAETGAMIWILLATYMELPVSTTHAIIGGIIGFARECAAVGLSSFGCSYCSRAVVVRARCRSLDL
jgi:sodium-dependent phosphate transporter